jgi:hypothetical protein
LDILVNLKGRKYIAHRITADRLTIGYPLILDNGFIHEILNISIEKGEVRLALKKYGILWVNSSDFMTVIQGSGNYW